MRKSLLISPLSSFYIYFTDFFLGIYDIFDHLVHSPGLHITGGSVGVQAQAFYINYIFIYLFLLWIKHFRMKALH